ncbi:MAG: ankyrin repeat domain-containing protein [Alphaproteobacteria bacterium]|nr:ankyrin repeat domain-containing protein [Alphaproteobacteria bacterium]
MAITKKGKYKAALEGMFREPKQSLLVLDAMLDAGVDPNTTTMKGLSPVHYLNSTRIAHDDEEKVQALFKKMVEKGLDLNVKLPMGETALHIAVEKNYIDVVKAMIVAGVHIGEKDVWKETAFSKAVRYENFEIASLLLDHGAVPSIRTDDPWDFLDIHVAACAKNLPPGFMTRMVETGLADINVMTKIRKEAPLHYVAGQRERLAELLQIQGLFLDPVNVDGKTPLYMAAIKDVGCLKDLIAAGARLDRGKCPLAGAAADGVTDSVRVLLEEGKEKGVTFNLDLALKNAVEKSNLDIMQILLQAGANINCKHGDGKTLMMLALEQESAESALALKDAGIDLSVKDNAGRTAVDYTKNMNMRVLIFNASACDVPAAPKKPAPHTSCIDVDMGNGLTGSFNFWTQQVIYTRGNAMSVQNFNDVQRQEAIEEAYALLKDRFGDAAPPFPDRIIPKKTMKHLSAGKV